MAKPFPGVISTDVRDSTPDWSPFVADAAPQGAPNVLIVEFHVADDVYVDVEKHLAAAFMRD